MESAGQGPGDPPCSHPHPTHCALLPSPPQVYTEAGAVKIASTSRQIGFVQEPPRGPALALCPGMLSQAHFVDAVLAPDPQWVDGMGAAAAITAAVPPLPVAPLPAAPGSDGAGGVALLEPPLLAAVEPGLVPPAMAPAAEEPGLVLALGATLAPAAEPSLPAVESDGAAEAMPAGRG